MKTLVPPPITKDWRPSESREGLLKMRHTTPEGGVFYSVGRWYVQDDTEATANFRFFGAAPAMAEALEALIQACDSAPPMDLLKHISDCYLKAKKSLLAAGYTESADQE